MTLAHGGALCPLDAVPFIAWILTVLGALKAVWYAWKYKRHHDQHHKDCGK